jgi:hypothetical protein
MRISVVGIDFGEKSLLFGGGLRYCIRHAGIVEGELIVVEKKLSSVDDLKMREGNGMVMKVVFWSSFAIQGMDRKWEIPSAIFMRI